MHPRLQRLDLRLEVDDPLDAGEVDAVLLREPLHLAEQGDVARAVPAAAAGRAAGAAPARAGRTAAASARACRPARRPRRSRRRRRRRPRRGRRPAGCSPLAPRLHRGRDLRPRVLVHLLGQALDDLALGRGQPDRDGDVEGDEQVAGLPLPGTPRPRTRSVRPLAVPAGTLSETVPSSVGTVSVVPKAASANVIGTVSVRSSPLRPNSACSATWTTTKRSPAGPPRRPGRPCRPAGCAGRP